MILQCTPVATTNNREIIVEVIDVVVTIVIIIINADQQSAHKQCHLNS